MMLAALDLGRISTAAAYLSEDVVVRLGNRETVFGAAGFTSLCRQMTRALRGVRHEVHGVWTAAEDPDVLIVNLTAIESSWAPRLMYVGSAQARQ